MITVEGRTSKLLAVCGDDRKAVETACEELRLLGYWITSAYHENDLYRSGRVGIPKEKLSWWEKADIRGWDALAYLPDWEGSLGANFEVGLAIGRGLVVMPVDWWVENADNPDKWTFGRCTFWTVVKPDGREDLA